MLSRIFLKENSTKDNASFVNTQGESLGSECFMYGVYKIIARCNVTSSNTYTYIYGLMYKMEQSTLSSHAFVPTYKNVCVLDKLCA